MVVKRQRKKKGGFLLGTLLGVAAGVAGGTALLRRAADQNERIEIEVDVERKRPSATVVAAAPAAPARRRAPGALDQLKARWQEAVAEGRVAAAEREAELEEQFARETKRVAVPPAIEGSAERLT